MVLTPVNPVIVDRFGRKAGMTIGAIVIIIGMIVAVTGKSVAQLAIGRFILGAGVSPPQYVVNSYCRNYSLITRSDGRPYVCYGDIATAMERSSYRSVLQGPSGRSRLADRASGFYNCGWFGGCIPAAAVTFGTNNLDSNLSWQIPLILQALGCLIVLFSVWFLPESPRFLMLRGKHDEALSFLIKYHGGGDPNDKLVALEYREFQEGIQLDGIDKRWWDCKSGFH